VDELRIRMFGGLTLEVGGQALPPIASRTGRSLFAYLVVNRDTSPTRDLLAGLFWPDIAEARARRRLSHALWQIQSVLNEAGVAEGYIEASPTTIRFKPDSEAWVDVDEFDDVTSVLKRDSANDLDQRTETLDRLVGAVGLYTGDFLAGFYDDWIFVEQERLRQALFATLRYVVRLSKSWGDFDRALLYARRLALLDPLDEAAHREVMRMCYLVGRPNEALAQFDRCASILASEIDASPTAETLALREEIALGRQSPLIPVTPNSRARLFEAQPTPLIGRTPHRQEVIARMEDALAGRGGMVLLEGEPGVGKTRLLTDTSEDANWRGLSVLWGGSAAPGISRPFGPLLAALEDGLTELRVHQLMERMDQVWLRALAPLLPSLQRWAPELEREGLRGGSEERQRVGEAFRRIFETLARLTPTVLILDDVHRADEDTMWALEALSAGLDETPLLICLAYRRLELQSHPGQWSAVRALDKTGRTTRIGLDPLSEADADELVRRLMPEGTSGALIPRLHSATGGNPLFILETLRAVHEQQVTEALKPPDGVDSLDVEELPVSSTVYELIAGRLDGLPGEPKHTAHALAVSGTGMDIDTLAEVCDLPRPEVLDAVDYLIQAGMISVSGGRYALSHEQLVTVAYDSMPATERPALHQRVAEQLERSGVDDPDSLGHHFKLGGLPDRASHYLELAAEKASRMSAFATARQRYVEALDQARQSGADTADLTRLLLAQEEVLDVLADRAGQAALLDQVDALKPGNPAQAATALRRRALLLASLSDYELSVPLARQALELDIRAGEKTAQAEDLRVLGLMAFRQSHQDEAGGFFERGLALAPVGSTLEADIRLDLAKSLAEIVRFDEAQAQLTEARAIFAARNDRRGLAGALGIQAMLYGAMGLEDPTESALIQAAETSEAIGYGYGVAINALNLGLWYHLSGRTPPAVFHLERSRDTFAAMQDRRGEAMAIANLASLHYSIGNDGASSRLSLEALAILDELDHGPLAALCEGTLAELALRRSDWAEARDRIGRGLARAGRPDATAARLQLLRSRARLLLLTDELAAGLALAEETHAACAAASLNWLEPDIRVVVAHARVLNGDADGALSITEQSPNRAFDTERHYWRMRAFQMVGREEEAFAALDLAHRAMMRRLDGLDPVLVGQGLTNVLIHRQLAEAWEANQPVIETVWLAAGTVPTGRPTGPGDLVEVQWTIADRLDGVESPEASQRGRQILRLTREAEEAGAAPTVADLAAALDVSTSTVRRDIETLRAAGHTVPTRGHRG